MSLTVTEAVVRRRSARAFLDRPVPPALVREILELARRSPSAGNLQPWRLYLLAGDAREALVAAARGTLAADPALALAGTGAGYDIYPAALPPGLHDRKARAAAQLYATLGIDRADTGARLAQVARNFEFYGAPVGGFVTVPATAGPVQFLDAGLFLQTVALLAAERGLALCMQAAWANWHTLVRAHVPVGADELLLCGLSLGYPDPDAPVNGMATERAPVDQFACLLGTPLAGADDGPAR
ncbi:MAG TPA: nitroreductase [Azospirillaceae bacterium]|nr:nitroreductase [Azospirillaceae bacterium]